MKPFTIIDKTTDLSVVIYAATAKEALDVAVESKYPGSKKMSASAEFYREQLKIIN